MQLKLNEHPPNSQICVSNNWFYENHLRLNRRDMHRVTSYTIGMFSCVDVLFIFSVSGQWNLSHAVGKLLCH